MSILTYDQRVQIEGACRFLEHDPHNPKAERHREALESWLESAEGEEGLVMAVWQARKFREVDTLAEAVALARAGGFASSADIAIYRRVRAVLGLEG